MQTHGAGKHIAFNMKLIKTLLFLFAFSAVWGQYDGKDSLLVSRYRPGFMWFNTGWRPAEVGKPRKYDRLIFDLTYNTLVANNKMQSPNFLRSIGFNVNTMWDIPLNEGNGFALGIGIRYGFQRVGFQGTFSGDSTNSFTTYNPTIANGAEKQLIGSHVFSIPLEVRLRMKKWKQAKLHLGGSIGYRAGTFTKQWFDQNNLIIKSRSFNDASGLTFGVHARIGIRNWAFFADYTLSKQFENKQSTPINPLSFGISLSVF